MQEIITGDKTGGGREKKREEGGKYCSSVQNKYQAQGKVDLYVEKRGDGSFRLGCSLYTPSHIKAPTPSGAGPSNGPPEDARGRESAETPRAFRPADPAARHNLQEEGAGSNSGHLTKWGGGFSAARPLRGPVAFRRLRWCDFKPGKEPHPLNDHPENEGRRSQLALSGSS